MEGPGLRGRYDLSGREQCTHVCTMLSPYTRSHMHVYTRRHKLHAVVGLEPKGRHWGNM